MIAYLKEKNLKGRKVTEGPRRQKRTFQDSTEWKSAGIYSQSTCTFGPTPEGLPNCNRYNPQVAGQAKAGGRVPADLCPHLAQAALTRRCHFAIKSSHTPTFCN